MRKIFKLLREKRGYTQEQLAEAVDLSHLSKVESGRRRIGMKVCLSILQVLKVAVKEFVSIAVEGENDFKQYQDIMRDCDKAEKKFLLDTLKNIKLNMKVLMCDDLIGA